MRVFLFFMLNESFRLSFMLDESVFIFYAG